MLVGDMLRRNAWNYPQKVGVVFGDHRYTWQQVNNRVNSLSNALLALGLRKQERVAILLRNCNQFLEAYFALAKAGVIAVPINNRLGDKEISYLIGNSGAIALIMQQEFESRVRAIKAEIPSIKSFVGIGKGHSCDYDFEELIKKYPSSEPEVEVTEGDIFAIGYTSGTTGRPKGAILTHKNSTTGATIMAMEMRLKPSHNYLFTTQMHFSPGGGARWHALLRGCTCIIINFEPELALATIEKEKIYGFTGAPAIHSAIINHPDVHKYDLSSLGMVGFTSAPMPVELWKKAASIYGNIGVSMWSLTEAVNAGTCLQLEDVFLEGLKARRLGSIGKAMVNMDVAVVDENDRPVRQNGTDTGEIVVRSDTVMKGYWNLPQESEEAFRGGWLRTNDLAVVDEDGFIYIVDRRTDMIISGGINIYPREIEEVIYTHPKVLHCAVVGVPDEKWGETPKAVIVLKEGMKATENEIIELCKQNLASYKKPTSVDFVESMPMTSSMKIIKRELKERYWKRYEKRVH